MSIKNTLKAMRTIVSEKQKIKRIQKGIRGAQAFNSAMRGGAKAGLSGRAASFAANNPGATRKGAKPLTEKYR